MLSADLKAARKTALHRKKHQLGMDPGTAAGRLIKDLLFTFAIDAGHQCYRCCRPLTRTTFSVDHIKPWLNSPNPQEMFFDLKNIAFSHLACNVGDRRPSTNLITDEELAAMPAARRKRILWNRASQERQAAARAAAKAAK